MHVKEKVIEAGEESSLKDSSELSKGDNAFNEELAPSRDPQDIFYIEEIDATPADILMTMRC